MNHFKHHFNPNDPSKDSTPEEFDSELLVFVKELQKLSDGIESTTILPVLKKFKNIC